MSVNSILNLMRELDLRGALAAFERMVSSPQELDAMSTQLLLETLLQNEVNDRLIVRLPSPHREVNRIFL